MNMESIKNKIGEIFARLLPTFRIIALWLKRFVWVFPPAIVLVAMLALFQANGLYPFGGKTMAWCDMEQQLIPLLLQFKDILWQRAL